MKVSRLALLGMLFSGVAWVAAQDVPTTQPDSDATIHHTRTRIPKPYSELSDLTDDQKSKILDIHAAMLEAYHKLEDDEKAQIAAVLTDDQKKELDTVAAQSKETGMKARIESRIQAEKDKLDHLKATTQPS